eukprot:3745129-Amphidinium_carterae.1
MHLEWDKQHSGAYLLPCCSWIVALSFEVVGGDMYLSLSGTIPQCLARHTRLFMLVLRNHQLRGDVPRFRGTFRMLDAELAETLECLEQSLSDDAQKHQQRFIEIHGIK